MCQLWFSKKTVGNIFCTFFRADGVLGAAIAGAGMVVVGGTVLALAGAAALVGMVVKKKWGDATQDISHLHWSTWPPTQQFCLVVYIHAFLPCPALYLTSIVSHHRTTLCFPQDTISHNK